MMSAEKLTKSVPRTVLPQNELQINSLAVRLRKMHRHQRGSHASNADIDQYNNRQIMPARETRSKRLSGLTSAEQAAYAGGLTDQEWWAFQAYAMDVDTTHQLTLAVHKIAAMIAQEQDWDYKNNWRYPQLIYLSKLVIDEWLHPMRYLYHKRKGPVESASAFAGAMHMDRATWHKHWRTRWLLLKPVPRDWYLHATHTIDANYSGGLRTFTAPAPRRR